MSESPTIPQPVRPLSYVANDENVLIAARPWWLLLPNVLAALTFFTPL